MSKRIYLSVAPLLAVPLVLLSTRVLLPHLQQIGPLLSDWSLVVTSPDQLLIVAMVLYFIGGTVKGTFGIGMGLITVTLMAALMDPRIAIMLFVFPVLLTNVWQAFRDGQIVWLWNRYKRLAISMVVVMGITTSIATRAPAGLLTLLLGAVAVLFACINLGIKMPMLPRKLDIQAQYIAGCTAGFMGGVSGLVVIPLVAYLTAKQTRKDEFVASLGMLLMLSGLVLGVSYWRAGVYTPQLAGYSLLLVIPAMAGIFLGEKLRRLIPSTLFKKIVLVLILFIGVNLIHRGLVI